MSLKLLVIGAHPDDAEFHAGGLIAAYAASGHRVRVISVTNGGAGHHFRSSEELAALRREEIAASAAVIGAEAEAWEFPDGSLMPDLNVRRRVIREIRSFEPDLVLTHRCCDSHPDHRAVGQVVQDASYMVTVPLVDPETPYLKRDPVVAYMPDHFTKPAPLEPHIVLDTTPWLDTITKMAACHASQVFEFLPVNRGRECPEDPQERFGWLRAWLAELGAGRAEQFRDALIRQYAEAGAEIQCAEAYEISEYAAPLTDQRRGELFDWLY